jgi:hypothetical protein
MSEDEKKNNNKQTGQSSMNQDLISEHPNGKKEC